ncbi:MAG: hypothetical protein J6R82_06495 [Clostridia bacterium]|nr:hypothetical protein [Clostridia bacterium]
MKSLHYTISTIPTSALLFFIGLIGYPLIELLWRGRTHWTMALAGGLAMVLLLWISRSALPRPLMWGAGALAITAVEFAIGYVVNLRLHWAVWDYSALPLNVAGQICLPFTVIWFFLSIPGIALCQYLERLSSF